jgi:YHS domain-containing protein
MGKGILRIGICIVLVAASAVLCRMEYARAGTYTLQYPQGYGCRCIPNALEFGYFRTQWREWPGEIRPDKTFPGSIGREAIPAPAGQEIIQPPRAAVPSKTHGETIPEGVEQPSDGKPSGLLTEPGKETPLLPQLPTEPGGINILPGLPPDLNMPPAINTKDKEPEESKPSTEFKPESGSKTESKDKGKADETPSAPKQEDKGARIESPAYPAVFNRVDPIRQSSQMVRSSAYIEPGDSPMAARLSRDVSPQYVSPQSHQRPGESNAIGDISQGRSEITASWNEPRPPDAQSAAIGGFCPVELSLHGRWVQGNSRWAAEYKGNVYHFSGNAQRQEFLADPEKYIPANGGNDLVTTIMEKRNVPGHVNYCAAYKGRIYMFSGPGTQNSFRNDPESYIGRAAK